MKCVACGYENPRDGRFCTNCGASLSVSPASNTGVESAELPMPGRGRQLGSDECFCSSCGDIIKKLAEICPKCGVRLRAPPPAAPEKRRQSKFKLGCLSFIGVIVVINLISAIVSPGEQDQSEIKVAGVEGETEQAVPNIVNLRDILDLRDANEVAADSKYIGMHVSLDGEITEIHEEDFTIIPPGSDMFQMAGAKCKIDERQLDRIIQLRKGQSVTIVGIIKDIDDVFYNMLEVKPCRLE